MYDSEKPKALKKCYLASIKTKKASFVGGEW